MKSIESDLCSIWCKVLQVPSVELDSNFFELGGDSVLAMMLSFEVAEQLFVDLPPECLFDSPTVRLLAAQIAEIKQVALD